MAFTIVPVRGNFRRADGTDAIKAAKGSVEFVLNQTLHDTGTNNVLTPQKIVVELDEDGDIATNLVATDDAGVKPEKVKWQVIERITDAPVRSYDIEVPMAKAGAGIDLADVAPT